MQNLLSPKNRADSFDDERPAHNVRGVPCLSTAALEATGGGATKVDPVGPCLLHLRLLLLRLSDVLCPLVLSV